MKLITEYSFEGEAEAARAKLRKRGIHTHISSRYSHRLSGITTGAQRVGLWATFNNQYEDACKVIVGQRCQVRHPLAEEQMRDLEAANKEYAPDAILKILAVVLGGVALGLVVLYRWHQNA